VSTLTFGWSYFEEVYKLRRGAGNGSAASSRFDDGRLGWADFEVRAQDTLHHWEIEEHNGNRIAGMWQQTLPDWQEVFIPIEKAVHFRTRTHKGNPEGKSFLRGVYRAWYLKKRIEEIEAIGIERDLVGLPVMLVPPKLLEPGASADDQAFVEELKKIVAQVRRDEREGLVLPAEEYAGPDGQPVKTGYKFSLLTSGGSRQLDTSGVISRYNEQIARGLLHHFWTLGSGPTGSRALSSDLTDLSALAVGSILDVFVDTLNAQSVPRLMRLNGFAPETWPRLTHGDIEKQELDRAGTFLAAMVGAGVITPDEGLERYARGLAGAPTIGEGLVDVSQGPGGDPNAPVDPNAPAPAPALGGGDVQKHALNGPQVAALRQLAADVAANQLPASTARAIAIASFPIDDTTLDEIFGQLETFAPAAPAEPAATPGEPR
jgi:hypothetical protein